MPLLQNYQSGVRSGTADSKERGLRNLYFNKDFQKTSEKGRFGLLLAPTLLHSADRNSDFIRILRVFRTGYILHLDNIIEKDNSGKSEKIRLVKPLLDITKENWGLRTK